MIWQRATILYHSLNSLMSSNSCPRLIVDTRTKERFGSNFMAILTVEAAPIFRRNRTWVLVLSNSRPKRSRLPRHRLISVHHFEILYTFEETIHARLKIVNDSPYCLLSEPTEWLLGVKVHCFYRQYWKQCCSIMCICTYAMRVAGLVYVDPS
jgi:hypothetical protein